MKDIRLNTNGLKMYTFDGHGHSNASDGLDTPEKIIDYAIEKGVKIIGLSDHNVIDNIPKFLDYSDKINATQKTILPIPGVEYSTTKGHILVLLPLRKHIERFMQQFKKPQTKPHPLDFIEEYIRKYNAIIVFVHPDMFIHGISTKDIELLLKKIPEQLHKNIGIEIYNWMAQAIFWRRAKDERKLHIKNQTLKLATFSFTDYHAACHIGNGSTAIYMPELTDEAFLNAIQMRRTSPLKISNRGIAEYIEIIKTTIRSSIIIKKEKRVLAITKI